MNPDTTTTTSEDSGCVDDCCSTLNTLILQQELLRKTVYVAYGSEKGNAQQIAERCHRTALEKGYRHTKFGTLDEHLSLIKEASAAAKKKKEEGAQLELESQQQRFSLVVVVSTTGNGDAPKGAEKFFSFIKKRDHPSGMLSHVDYLVLALGDTNYEKFCYVGKTIDTALSRLGANRLRPIATADAPNDFEVVVESFFDHLWDAVWPAATRIQHLDDDDDVRKGGEAGQDETEIKATSIHMVTTRHQLEGSSSSSGMKRGPLDQSRAPDGGVSPQLRAAAIAEERNGARTLSSHLSSMESLSLGESAGIKPPLATDYVGWCPSKSPVKRLQDTGVTLQTLLDRTKSSTLPTKRKPFVVTKVASAKVSENPRKESTATEEKKVKIVKARYLVNHRAEDVREWRVVVEAVLELPEGMSYLPGDSIAIPTRNPLSEVCAVLRRLKDFTSPAATSSPILTNVGDEALLKTARETRLVVTPPPTLSSTSSFSSSSSSSSSPSINDERKKSNNSAVVETDLAAILETRVDLISTPGKSALFVLSDCCTDEGDEIRMKYLSSFAGRDDYADVILGQRLTVAEVLGCFPSCRPTIAQLLTALDSTSAPLPRYYSIANSPLDLERFPSNHARIIFTVVRDRSPSHQRVLRGLCSSELERACFGLAAPAVTTSRRSDDDADGGRYITGQVSIKPNPSFRVPENLGSPIIMVGAGTGMAPFLGFISHRGLLRKEKAKREKRNAAVVGTWRGGGMLDDEDDFDFEEREGGEEIARAGSVLSSASSVLTQSQPGEEEGGGASRRGVRRRRLTVLTRTETTGVFYYGCRRENFDDLERDEVESFLKSGELARLSLSCSRSAEKGTTHTKEYVQDAIVRDAERLLPLLLSPSTHVFVCGGVRMAKDVLGAFREVVRIGLARNPSLLKGNVTALKDEKEFLDDAMKRGRYVQDIWG